MKLFVTNILLTFVWLFLTGEFKVPNFILGFITCYLILWLAFGRDSDSRYFRKGLLLIDILFFLIKEIIRSNFEVAKDMIKKGKQIKPGVIRIHTKVDTDFELVVLSNMITLTPGNLVLDYVEETKSLYVHLLNGDTEESTRESLRVMERKIRELFN